MKLKMNFQALVIIVLGLSLNAQAREKWDNNHHSSKEHDCKKDVTRIECPVICIDKVPFRIKESGNYLIKKDLHHYDKCPAITVEVDHVQIEFCTGAELTVGGCSTGIKVKNNDVTILNGTFKTKSDKARAIELSSDVKDWTIEGCSFNDFEEAISATNFSNGVLSNCDFCQCRIGFQQHGMDSLAKRFKAKHIRAEYQAPDSPCPPLFGPDGSLMLQNIPAVNARLSWVISLNGEVINSTIEKLQLNSTAIYCFKCRDCVIDNIQLDYPDATCEATYGIQCGGPRGAETFIFFTKPEPSDIEQGCINCKVSNVKVRMITRTAIFTIGIMALFCKNCEIVDNEVFVDGGGFERPLGAGIVESYCTNCVLRRCQAEGPCIIGLHVCDIFDKGTFCIASVTEDCKARNCWFGITQIRCFGSVTKNTVTTQNRIGILLSEGATNPIVDNCYITENAIGVLYATLGTCDEVNAPAPNCFNACFSNSFVPDSFKQPPCNGLLSNSILNGNRIAILEGPADICNPSPAGPFLVLQTENNIIRPFIAGCGIQPDTDCPCINLDNCPVPPTAVCP